MEDYTIRTKEVDKEVVVMIECFLASPSYDPNILDKSIYKSKALCWIGLKKRIKEDLRLSGDLLHVIIAEIDEFHLSSDGIIRELAVIAGPDEVQAMIETVERFIAQSIKNMAD